MQSSYYSTLILTLLLAIGLAFFLRAASKDRTTVVEISSPLPAIDILNGISSWLEGRGWMAKGGNADKKLLIFKGNVMASPYLAVFLSLLCSLGGACLGLVICQLYSYEDWWPLLLSIIGPFAGLFYRSKAARSESFEIRLISSDSNSQSILRIRAHRDELIALDKELSKDFKLFSDASLTSSPI